MLAFTTFYEKPNILVCVLGYKDAAFWTNIKSK